MKVYKSYCTSYLLFTLILGMVAEVVTGGSEGSASSSSETTCSSTMAKAFSTTTKLTDTNYTVWNAGILTVLMAMTVDPHAKLMVIMEGIRDKLHMTLDTVEN